MEKKVLLQDLVETGRNVRKQIISKVRVSDKGIYPIGEIWDANTTLDMIVNGAEESHDTVRELDEFAHSVANDLQSEITRATNIEQLLDENKADKSSVYTKGEVYTKEEVDLIINNILQQIQEIIEIGLSDDSVGSNHIINNSILLEDLSDEIRDKLEVTVDEDEENANFG